MSRRQAPVYSRGKYWLDWDAKKDGTLRSPFLTIFWYDPDAGRVRSASTGTGETAQAMNALDLRFLGDKDEAPAFCHACGQPMPSAESYLINDAIADYRLEHGDHQPSADSIYARLKHVTDFLEADDRTDLEARFGIETSCAIAATEEFANAFRGWNRRQPVVSRNKAGAVTSSRPRSPATVEESIVQLAAALNHACDARPPRSNVRPMFRPLSRAQVSPARRHRSDVAQLARIAAYAAEPRQRRGALQGFLVGTLTTLGRPSSVVDINVHPDRRQWWPGATSIELNPPGRVQTKKRRPMLPLLPLLAEWLIAEHADLMALDEADRVGRGWLVNYYGSPVRTVKTAWDTMLVELGLPTVREWKPYILRHSLATMCRRRGAHRWEVEGWMGHRAPGQTEIYAAGEEFPSVVKALQEVIDEINHLAPGALHRNNTGAALTIVKGGRG